MYKKSYFILLLIFIFSFFFIPKNTYASTFDYNIPQTIVDQINNNLSSKIDRVESYFESNPNIRKKYFIEYSPNNNAQQQWQVYISDTGQWVNLYYTNNNLQYYTNNVIRCSITTSVNNCSTFYGGNNITYIMYSTYRIPSVVGTNGTTVNYNFPDFTFSFTFSATEYFYDLYTVYTDHSTPPDPTPLLTNFIDISIDKLSSLCDFLTSSYIYLFIFVIFIFYFVIFLFRRLR